MVPCFMACAPLCVSIPIRTFRFLYNAYFRFEIEVSPKRQMYEARLRGEEAVLCAATEPFFAAARVLLQSGRAAAADILVMRHARSEAVALRCPVGRAAKLTVDEGEPAQNRALEGTCFVGGAW